MKHLHSFAKQVVADHEDHLLDWGPDEQIPRIVAVLEKLNARRPLQPYVKQINAFGFGTAQTCFVTGAGEPEDIYLRLLPLTEALGIGVGVAAKLAEQRHLWSIREQREEDEKAGSLGWTCLNTWIDLDMWMAIPDPEAKPDAGGRRWTHASEWLVSLDRVTELVLSSPWSREFMDNSRAMFSHAFKKSGLEDHAGGAETIVQTVDETGKASWTKSGRTIADHFAEYRAGVSEEESRRRAFRGPSLGGAA